MLTKVIKELFYGNFGISYGNVCRSRIICQVPKLELLTMSGLSFRESPYKTWPPDWIVNVGRSVDESHRESEIDFAGGYCS